MMDGMTEHFLKLVAGSREVPLEENPGWMLRVEEPDTLAQVTCSCGLDSGSLPRDEASAVAEDHLRLMRQGG